MNCVELEHQFAGILDKAMQRGWGFDYAAAEVLVTRLVTRRAEVDVDVTELFPPKTVTYTTPKKKLERQKVVVFNPSSRQQIAERLIEKYGWKPLEFTPTGHAKVDEEILGALPWHEAKVLAERFLLQKRLAQLAEGQQGWMRLARKQSDGSWRLYCRILHIGTVTHRCAHRGPNLAQVPANSAPYGKECRALFVPRPGWKAVGADASGLELRCLAHYMNDSAYTDELLQGDIHTTNMHAWEVSDRSVGKRLTYACLYGAGDRLLGGILGGNSKDGKAARARFMKNLPALGKLVKGVQRRASSSGVLRGLDGRRLPVRNQHSALNTLLQGAGAVAMKLATVEAERLAEKDGLCGKDYGLVGHIHDEMQYEASVDAAPVLANMLPTAFREAGQQLGFRLPLDGDSAIGCSWKDTH